MPFQQLPVHLLPSILGETSQILAMTSCKLRMSSDESITFFLSAPPPPEESIRCFFLGAMAPALWLPLLKNSKQL